MENKNLNSAVTAIFLDNGKKIDTSLGISEHRHSNGIIMGYFIRTGLHTIQTVGSHHVVSIETTYESSETLDEMFRESNIGVR